MSDTHKTPKTGRMARGKPRSKRQGGLRANRHSFGRTEKILRRNRQTWTRKFAKEGRRLDKEEIKEQQDV